jgi:hypothetical protein
VLAAGMESREDAQVRIGEQPAFCLTAGGSSRSRDGAEMPAASDGAKVLGADSRQRGNFIFREDFLSGFDSDHFRDPFLNRL